MAQYLAWEVQPFGVNPAPAERHADYARRLGLPFPLLSDPDLAVARAYRAVQPTGQGIARCVYLVDRDGSIRFARWGAPGAAISLESLQSG